MAGEDIAAQRHQKDKVLSLLRKSILDYLQGKPRRVVHNEWLNTVAVDAHDHRQVYGINVEETLGQQSGQFPGERGRARAYDLMQRLDVLDDNLNASADAVIDEISQYISELDGENNHKSKRLRDTLIVCLFKLVYESKSDSEQNSLAILPENRMRSITVVPDSTVRTIMHEGAYEDVYREEFAVSDGPSAGLFQAAKDTVESPLFLLDAPILEARPGALPARSDEAPPYAYAASILNKLGQYFNESGNRRRKAAVVTAVELISEIMDQKGVPAAIKTAQIDVVCENLRNSDLFQTGSFRKSSLVNLLSEKPDETQSPAEISADNSKGSYEAAKREFQTRRAGQTGRNPAPVLGDPSQASSADRATAEAVAPPAGGMAQSPAAARPEPAAPISLLSLDSLKGRIRLQLHRGLDKAVWRQPGQQVSGSKETVRNQIRDLESLMDEAGIYDLFFYLQALRFSDPGLFQALDLEKIYQNLEASKEVQANYQDMLQNNRGRWLAKVAQTVAKNYDQERGGSFAFFRWRSRESKDFVNAFKNRAPNQSDAPPSAVDRRAQGTDGSGAEQADAPGQSAENGIKELFEQNEQRRSNLRGRLRPYYAFIQGTSPRLQEQHQAEAGADQRPRSRTEAAESETETGEAEALARRRNTF